MAQRKKQKIKKNRKAKSSKNRPRCGLCGKTGKLTKTECCGQWICDDEDQYVLFSYARNSCYRNHDRFTLCSYHYHEGHKGDWKECRKCREDFKTELYVWHGTNEYNFALGQKRANSAKQYLISLGVSSFRIDIISYGKEKPLCNEQNETCWQKNRRAHFVFIEEGK